MISSAKTTTIKRIAIVAHDNKRIELIEWSYNNRHLLKQHQIIATGTAANVLEGTLNKAISKLPAGPQGGDQQLNSLITDGGVDAIIFFWDPLQTEPHNSDVEALIRVATSAEIVIACNESSADMVLSSLFNEQEPVTMKVDALLD